MNLSKLVLCLSFLSVTIDLAAMEGTEVKNRGLFSSLFSEVEYLPWVFPAFPVYKPFYDISVSIWGWFKDLFARKVPYTGECGKQAENYTQKLFPQTRIIGGTIADPHTWPWQVHLRYRRGDRRVVGCGGSLIRVNEYDAKTDIVLTAAHCVTNYTNQQIVFYKPWRLRVIVGQHDRSQRKEPGRKVHRVSRILPHENYDPITNRNDIALVKLATPARFTDTVRPICLPELGEPIPHENLHCVATGWGRTKITEEKSSSRVLKQLVMKIHKPSNCQKKVWAVFGGWGHEYVEEIMICAGPYFGVDNTCYGDSGGPLACLKDGKWTVYGIVSFGRAGTGCVTLGKPDIFSRVSNYTDWIQTNSAMLTSMGSWFG